MGAIKFDGTINLPLVAMVIGALFAAGVWVNTVNTKLDTVASIVVDQKATSDRLAKIENQILINRAETIKNREVYLRGEGAQ